MIETARGMRNVPLARRPASGAMPREAKWPNGRLPAGERSVEQVAADVTLRPGPPCRCPPDGNAFGRPDAGTVPCRARV